MHWYAIVFCGWIGMHLVWWLGWVILAIGIWWAVSRSGVTSNLTVLQTPLRCYAGDMPTVL